MQYFSLDTDDDSGKEWGVPQLIRNDIDDWCLSAGKAFNGATPIHFSNIYREGTIFNMDFSSDPFGTLLCSSRFKTAVEPLTGCDVEYLPAVIENEACFFVMNILSIANCIDRRRSTIIYKDNQIDAVVKVAIDGSLVQEKNIFRLRYWQSCVIVSERIADILREGEFTNVKLDLVS